WKSLRIKGAELKAQEHCLNRQAAVFRQHSHVSRIIARNVRAFCANDNGDHERQSINSVSRQNQNWSVASLFASFYRIQINEVNLSALNGHQARSKPSDSAIANSRSISCTSRWISGSAAI